MIGGTLVDVPSQATTAEKRHGGPHPHKRAPWLRAGFAGAVICGVLGPALPLLVLIPVSAFKDASSFEALRTLAAFPVAWLFALIPMGLPGAIFGVLGAVWIRFRSSGLAPRRLFLETGLLGTLLGAIVPLTTLIFGWGGFRTVLSGYVPVGAITGAVCALLVLLTLRKRGLLFDGPSG